MYSNAQNTIRGTLNTFKNIASNVKGLTKATDKDTVENVLKGALGIAGTAAQSPYVQGLAALSGLSIMTIDDWQTRTAKRSSMPLAASPTAVIPPTTNSTSSTDANSTITQEYILDFKDGTSLEAFEEYVQKLPDHGVQGFEMIGPYRPSYITNLTQAEADERRSDSIIKGIWPNVPYIAIDLEMEKRGDRPTNNRNLWVRDPSTLHLSLMSKDQNFPESEDFYGFLFHPSQGSGTTIYALDRGLNTNHDEFQNRQGATSGWCVPNSVTGANAPDTGPNALKEYAGWNETARHYIGHGTSTASVAVGKTLGVASNANFIMVKHSNGLATFDLPPAAPFSETTPIPLVLRWAFNSIIQDVKAKNLQRKAVFYTGMMAVYDPTIMGQDSQNEVWKEFIEDCQNNEIIVVVPAGNYGNNWSHGAGKAPSQQAYSQGMRGAPWTRDLEVPNRLVTAFPNVITVGGITGNGSLDWATTPVGFFGTEPNTVYALSDNVKVAAYYDNHGLRLASGNSFSAPMIAGLVSYFLGLPDSMTNLKSSQNFFQDVKQMITDNAWQRVSDDKLISFPTTRLNYANVIPTAVPAAYNGAWKE